jgi:hypothetical protein
MLRFHNLPRFVLHLISCAFFTTFRLLLTFRVDNKKQGFGEFYFVKGNRYVGDFKNDMMCGKGTLHGANNTKYVGRFKDGKKHGKGISQDANGVYFEEEWDMNVQVMRKEITGTVHLDVRS